MASGLDGLHRVQRSPAVSCVCLVGVDPDDTYNETPYEKGFCFVSYLAHLVGDQSRFDAFLRVLHT